MGVFDNGYEQSVLDAGRNPVERPPAGFLETFLATFEATRQEDLSNSEILNVNRKKQERRRIIKELTGEDLEEPIDITGLGVGEPVNKAVKQRISELAARYPEVKTDEELTAEIVEESQQIREKTGKVLENTTFSGKVGSFTGAMAAAMTDPLIIGTMPFGASWGAGILRTAVTEAGIGLVSEAFKHGLKLSPQSACPID